MSDKPIEVVAEVTSEAKEVKAKVVGDSGGSITVKATEAQVITTKKARIRELGEQIENWQIKIKDKKNEITRLKRQIVLLEKSLELTQ